MTANDALPAAIVRTPSLDRWIRFEPDGTVCIFSGKVELGQGICTALAMIAAEELDVPVARVHVQTADTELTPNEGVTAGSMSVQDSGSAVRVAAATAKRLLFELAAEYLEVDARTLEVEGGLITSVETNEQTDYWSLLEDGRFGFEITQPPVLKNPRAYQVVGRRTPRADLPAKVRGEAAFVHDLVLPRMLHGRMVKPPQPWARLVECPRKVTADDAEIVRDGTFLGVVAKREDTAIAAAGELAAACRWEPAPLHVAREDLEAYLRSHVTHSLPVVDGTPVDAPVPEPLPRERGTRRFTASYFRPYQMHASLAPSAAIAQYVNGKLTVYSHSQGVELLKLALADALALPVNEVHVMHAEGAGCYGHNGAEDVAFDAAVLAIAAQPEPVKVVWSRADEHGFEPYAPAAVVDMQADLDARGRIRWWRHETCSFSHIGRPRPHPGHTNLQSAWWRDPPMSPAPRAPLLLPEVGIHRNLQPIYDLPRTQLVKHFVAESPLRTSSLRSLGAFANVFAIESFMEELAHAAGADPFEFRLRHLADARARAVLELLREKTTPIALEPGTGRGIALARYKNQQTWCAVAVDAAVGDDAHVVLRRAVIIADAGLVIDPDGIVNQLEGGFIQAASWTLREAVAWDAEGITSRNWETYPILRFSEVPVIETHLIDRRHEPALGAGEAATGPTPAAIANAVFHASGLRLRAVPFTADRVRETAAR